MNRTIIIVLLLVGCAGAGLYLYLGSTPKKTIDTAVPQTAHVVQAETPAGTHVITLTPDGFTPDTVTIRAGETVTFKTTTGKIFWPASNLHPSHQLYPEFDPLEPIKPENVWGFTFKKVGVWKFHDHLSPYFTGVITVTP